MKLTDSLNPATQAENIKKLNAELEAVDAKTLPSTSTATTGQILKLTGETKTPSWASEYTPPAYSETEVNTGQKWIDGKDIYSIVVSDTIPTLTAASPVEISLSANTVIHYRFIVQEENVDTLLNNSAYYYRSTSKLSITGIQPAYSNKNYICLILYTKPDPVPGDAKRPEEVEEPETKKTTRKKTTK